MLGQRVVPRLGPRLGDLEPDPPDDAEREHLVHQLASSPHRIVEVGAGAVLEPRDLSQRHERRVVHRHEQREDGVLRSLGAVVLGSLVPLDVRRLDPQLGEADGQAAEHVAEGVVVDAVVGLGGLRGLRHVLDVDGVELLTALDRLCPCLVLLLLAHLQDVRRLLLLRVLHHLGLILGDGLGRGTDLGVTVVVD